MIPYTTKTQDVKVNYNRHTDDRLFFAACSAMRGILSNPTSIEYFLDNKDEKAEKAIPIASVELAKELLNLLK